MLNEEEMALLTDEVEKQLSDMMSERVAERVDSYLNSSTKGLETDELRTSAVLEGNIANPLQDEPAVDDSVPAATFRHPVVGLNTQEQTFPCQCYTHEGQFINKGHIDDCSQRNEHHYSDEGVVVGVGPQYTTVTVWQPGNLKRQVQGLAQVKSNDPIGYAREQLEEAQRRNEAMLRDNPTLFRSYISAVGGPLPEPVKLKQYHTDDTTFYLAVPGKAWYRQQGFKWYTVAAIAVGLFAAKTVLAVVTLLGWNGTSRRNIFGRKIGHVATRRIVLTKHDLIGHLRFYTAIPHIPADDRKYIAGLVTSYEQSAITAKEVSSPRVQNILRFSQNFYA